MVDPHIHRCPEPEVLAAYVDRGLSLSERARVDTHLASCPQCIALVAGVARTVADVSALVPDAVVAAEATPLVTRRALAGAVAAAAAVMAIVAAPSLVRSWLDRDAGLVNLVGTVGEQRSVLGRLTGGIPHAPLGAPPAGGQGGRAGGTDRVQLTAGRIRESFGERATPAQLHALGVAQLLAGRYDDAAQALLAASREQPANARYLNDVATAQLERARLGLRSDDLPRALASADRARRLDPSLKEAWFNRALAASALSLRDQAKDDWTHYLKLDSSSRWAGEARSRLQELSNPTTAQAWTTLEGRLEQSLDVASAEEAVRLQTTEARILIEQKLLPAWANAVLGEVDAQREIERVRVLATAMQTLAGDALYSDAVATIDRASQNRGALRQLASAHLAYAEAAALFNNDQFAEAVPKLADARKQLLAGESSFAQRAAIDHAGARLLLGDRAGALAILGDVKPAALGNGYAYIAGRAAWFEGVIAFAEGRLADTQAHYEDTLAIFERMRDAEQTVYAHNLLGSLHFYLGDRANEWKHRQAALQGLSISRSARLRASLLTTAAISLRHDNPEAALAMHNVALDAAREGGRGLTALEILTHRAVTLIALGRHEDAAADLAAARRELDAVRQPGLREVFELLILAPEGDVQRQRSPAQAVATAERALEIIRLRNNPADRSRVPAFQLQLAQANIVWGGRTAQAKVALANGIRAFDDERALFATEGRVSAMDQSWQLFETAVQLAIEEKDFSSAFAMAERARARTVAEARRAPVGRPLEHLQASLDESEAVIALNQFNDVLALWIIRQGSLTVMKRPLTRDNAVRLVSRQQDEIRQEASSPGASRALYNEIIRPAAAALRGVSKLVFVPDTTYQDAAFAALWDASRNRFLVEDFTLTVAPTVEAFVRSATMARADRRMRNPLILGGAARNADATALAVASLYPDPAIVTGSHATRSRFLADAPGHSLVHVAARTASNPAYPLLSRMLLADEPGRRHSGAVLGSEIASRGMSQTNLVVIDDIETNTAHRGEGTLSLARAFLTAGVPAVLGTLPGSNEHATRDLMIGFHREVAKNASAEQALSTVQRNAIQQNGRRLGAWTALVIYGSDR